MQEYPLSLAIQEGLKKEAGEEATSKYARPFFRASETYACGRRIAWNRKGVSYSNPYDPGSLVKMKMGDALHNWIRGYYIPTYTQYDVENWSEKKEEEQELRAEFNTGTVGSSVWITGHIDGVLVSRDTGIPVAIFEVKTMGPYGYKGVVKADFQDPGHYSMGYAKQANRYVHLWNKVFTTVPITQFCLFLFDTSGSADAKTGLPHRDYWFEANEDAFNQDLNFLAGIERRLKSPEDEPRGYLAKGWECDKCTFRDLCWSGAPATLDDADPAKGQRKPRKTKPRASKKALSR